MKNHASVIQVFEHSKLLIDDKVFNRQHWNDLANYIEQNGGKYFTLLANGIQLKNYVGAIQVGNLTIEILPKADKINASKAFWQGILIQMLQECRLIQLNTWGTANLKVYPNSILELYFSLFLEEVERLLQKGLIRTYHRKQANLSSLKGRLLVRKQIQKNSIHPERFFTDHEVFDQKNEWNGIIYAALLLLDGFPLKVALKQRLRVSLEAFQQLKIKAHYQINSIRWNRKNKHYQEAIEMALMLLKNYRPDIRAGTSKLIAILFDMNLLFEEYLYRQLMKSKSSQVNIHRQLSKPFWQRHQVRPDIVVEWAGERMVLDTKWRILSRARPSGDDLKQLYVYAHYFGAKKAILLYPDVYGLDDIPPTAYEQGENLPRICCGLSFVPLIKHGQLNQTLGQELFTRLGVDQDKLST